MAMNCKPNDVVNSNLFKHTAPYIESISHSQLVFEICKASLITDVKLDRPGLDVALRWDNTPHGFEFWSALYSEQVRNARNAHA